ncbi:MAG TPA: hypothetical protein VMT53_03690 [Terriglobales bacterium]|nr:hypothetical protein [Terriglobales bacterium]
MATSLEETLISVWGQVLIDQVMSVRRQEHSSRFMRLLRVVDGL